MARVHGLEALGTFGMHRWSIGWLLALWFCTTGNAFALGLGDIHVNSALNQPFSAEIPLISASHEDLERLTVAVAGREAFLRLGVDRPAFLGSVSFRVLADGPAGARVLVRSSEPFTEPFVSLLIDLRWPGGELVREFPVLLDPAPAELPLPASAAPKRGAAAQTGAAPDSAAAPAREARVTPRPREAPPAPEAASTAAHRGHDTSVRAQSPEAHEPLVAGVAHTIVAGETLDGLVRRLAPAAHRSRAALRRALVEANPDAFDAGTGTPIPGAVIVPPAFERRAPTPDRNATNDAPRIARSRVPGARAAAPASDALAALEVRVRALEQALEASQRSLADEHAALMDLRASVEAHHAPSIPAPSAAAPGPTAPATVVPATSVADERERATTESPRAADSVAPVSGLRAIEAPPAGASAEPEPEVDVEAPPRPPVSARAAVSRAVRTQALTVGGIVLGVLALLLARALWRRHGERRQRLADAAWAKADLLADTGPSPVDARLSADNAASGQSGLWMKPELPAGADLEPDTPEVASGPPVAAAPAHGHADAAAELDASALPDATLGVTALIGIADNAEFAAMLDATGSLQTAADDATAEVPGEPQPPAAQESAPVDEPTAISPDLSILEGEITSTDVELTNRRYDHATARARQSDATDSLKSALRFALEREPDRNDLKVKLLEVYAREVIGGHQVFMDLASALARERGALAEEDWHQAAAICRLVAETTAHPLSDEAVDALLNCA